jgi:hypothetical protein
VVKQLVIQVFTRFGCPKQLLSDQGPDFDIVLIKELCKSLHIDKVRTSPYNASTKDAVERFHRTLNSMLGNVVAENQRDWDEWLHLVKAAYRASPHSATKLTHNRLILGRQGNDVCGYCTRETLTGSYGRRVFGQFCQQHGCCLEAAFRIVRNKIQCAAEEKTKLGFGGS